MQALVGLVGGEYIRSAEGGERLNAVYLELLLEHPVAFLSIIGRADEETRERAVAQLLNPVHDAYSGGDLLAAVRYARDRGLEAPFLSELIELYGELAVVHRQNIEQSRGALEEAVEACEHWGGEEPYDEERTADIMAGFERDCAAALELARESYWTSPSVPVIAALVVDLLGFLGPAGRGRGALVTAFEETGALRHCRLLPPGHGEILSEVPGLFRRRLPRPGSRPAQGMTG